VFFGTFLYALGFIGNFAVPKSIDSGPVGPLPVALAVNAGLLGLFALQHSIMARRWFKQMLTRVVPEPAERPTYVLASSLALILLFWQWRPMGGIIWQADTELAKGLLIAMFLGGALLVLVSTFLINHFDLFGLRQVWLYLRKKPYVPLQFRTPGPYRYVRHPLYVGWLFTFWSTPTMTAAHLFFALMTTAYIMVAIRFEERDLVRAHGKAYAQYREQVPMLVPSRGRAAADREDYNEATA
jgi:protein-S-isoprenylcysteine O-methyltransferase Ste14